MIGKFTAGLGAALLLAGTAAAQLATGVKAPDFKTMGAIGGETFRFHLAEQLEQGPVILYFFPKAFTDGCTLESKAFADRVADFEAAGAQVIGLSVDDVPTLSRFSTEVCRSKIPMVHASEELLEAYDVELAGVSIVSPMSNRTSYVIDGDGTVAMVHSEMSYKEHVAKSLAAARRLARR